jgi:hypothetical protein
MKIFIHIFSLLIISANAFGQLQLKEHKKLCLDGDVGRLMDIHVNNQLVIAKVGFGERIDALDYLTGQTVWSIKNRNPSGYGIFKYGDNISFSCNVNMYDEKLKKSITREWLFIANPSTGKKLDSILLTYSIVRLSTAYSPPTIPAVIQGSDVKMKAVLINAKTGEINRTFFTEQKEGSAVVVPTVVETDKQNKWLAVGTSNGTKGVYIHDFTTGTLIKHFPGKGDVTGIEFKEDNSTCIYLQNGTLHIVDTKTWTKTKEIQTSIVSGHMALHPNGENVVITGYGSQSKVAFVHLPTGTITHTDLVIRGGRPYFSSNGQFLLIPSEGIQCKVNPTKMPYLTLMTFDGTYSPTHTASSNQSTTTNPALTAGNFELGSRVYAKYSGRFYSATILSIKGVEYTVMYDDNFIEIKRLSDLKPLSPMKIGDKIQCRNSSGSFVDVTILDMKNTIVHVKHANGSTEWLPIRLTMQVE